MHDINYSETVRKGKFVFRSSYANGVGRILFYIFHIGLWLFITYILLADFYGNGSTVELRVITLLTLLAFTASTGYVLYKKAHDTKLHRVETGLTKELNEEFIRQFINNSNTWKIYAGTNDYIIAGNLQTFTLEAIQLTILFFDNYILLHPIGQTAHGFRYPYLFSLDEFKGKISAGVPNHKQVPQL